MFFQIIYIIFKIIYGPGQDVSRVLYLTIIYLDIPLPACSSDLPPGRQRATARQKAVRPFWSCSGWGLHETYVTIYPRELLPHDFTLTANAAVCFCCTFPIVTYAGRYPASSPCGARTFLTAPNALRDCLSYPDQ